MRRSKGACHSLLLVALLSAMAVPARASAQMPTFDLERLWLNPDTEGALAVATGELLPAGEWKLSLAEQYEHRPLLLSQEGVSAEVVAGRETSTLLGAYAFTDWLELDLSLPGLIFQQGTGLRDEGLSSFEKAGTAWMMPRLGLLSRRRAAIDLALGLGVGVPLGGSDGLTRDAGPGYTPSLMMGYSFGSLRVGTELGMLIRRPVVISPSATSVRDELGNEVRLGGALMQTGRRLRWELDALGRLPLTREPASGELLVGGRYFLTSTFELFGLVGAGLGSAPGTPTFRVVVGGTFGGVVPPQAPHEVLASCDGLPHSLQDCPGSDDDDDGVRNDVDLCPTQAGRAEFYGCPEMPDGDGDGVLDRDDQCPDQPGPASNHGCPIADLDGDGVPDEQDACRDKPGPARFNGCPDSDGDGIPDNLDRCPTQKGKKELQGCMPPDLDGDGVANSLDSCINDPGPADEEHAGCPIPPLVTIGREDPPVSGEAARAAPLRKALKLRRKVYFKEGVSELDPRSFELLDEVAKLLAEHTELMSVEVGAHTDARGTEQEQHRLTDLRADAVRRYLVSRGVDAKRLLARGYGHDKWVANDVTAQGREANRRVEIVVVSEEQVSSGGSAP